VGPFFVFRILPNVHSMGFPRFKKTEPVSKEPEEPGWELNHEPHPFIRIAIIVSVVLVVAGGISYWKRAAIRNYSNNWTAERHLKAASEALENGQGRVAISRANTALQLQPDEFSGYQLRLEGARQIRAPRILQYAVIVFNHPEADLADKAEALGAVADIGDAKTFAGLYASLSEEEQRDPDIKFEWIRNELNASDPAEVFSLLGEVSGDGLSRYSALMIECLFRMSAKERYEEAEQLTLQLLDATSGDRNKDREIQIAILGILAQQPSSRFSESGSKAITRKLEKQGLFQKETAAPTLRYTLQLASSPDRRKAILDEAITSLERFNQDELYRWLAGNEEFELLLSMMDPDEPIRSGAVFKAIVQALVVNERYTEAIEYLQFPPESIDKVWSFGTEAQLQSLLGNSQESVSSWRKAMIVAERDLTKNGFLRIARMAKRLGDLSVTADALVAASSHELGALPDFDEVSWMINYLVEEDRLDDLLTVSQRLLRRSRNPILINNAIYLSMISSDGKVISEDMVKTMEALRKEKPDSSSFTATAALAYCLSDREAEGLALYEEGSESQFDWEPLTETQKATVALILAKLGQAERFLEIEQAIDWSSVTSMEKRFFRTRLEQHKAALADDDSSSE